jgi:hypothetical protein
MDDLINTRLIATRPGRKRPARHTDLVILVGRDRIYTSAVRRLRLMGIPTWLVVPGRPVATSLNSSACAVTILSRPSGLPPHPRRDTARAR